MGLSAERWTGKGKELIGLLKDLLKRKIASGASGNDT